MLAVSVLGCSGSYAAPGGACTGYLMQSSEARVWLDAGPGTLANLQDACSLAELDAVVLTHAHPDHWLELPVVANALEWYEKRPRLPVYSNAHMAGVARELIGPGLDSVFDWRVIQADTEVVIGDQRWTFAETDHYVPTFAVLAESGGETILFTSDTGPAFSLAAMVAGRAPVDLALIESTFLDRSEHPGALHLSAIEAGAMAHEARVRRVMLTHQAPREDRDAHVVEAARKFSGEIVLAEVGRQYPATGA